MTLIAPSGQRYIKEHTTWERWLNKINFHYSYPQYCCTCDSHSGNRTYVGQWHSGAGVMTNWTPSGCTYVWLLLWRLPGLSYGNSEDQRTDILLERGYTLVTCDVEKPEERHTKGWHVDVLSPLQRSTDLQIVPWQFLFAVVGLVGCCSLVDKASHWQSQALEFESYW